MAIVALMVIALWLVLAAGVRTWLHVRAGRERPLRFADRPGSPQWWARLIGSVGFALLVLAPIAELAGLAPIADVGQPVRLAGLVLALIAVAGILASQAAMGSSWRGDVDPDVRTALVTTGPFRWVRNPILTASALASLGVALMVPNVVAVGMLGANIATYQILVRLVEEPYLERVHGESYRAYATRTGRFVPWIGRARRKSDCDDHDLVGRRTHRR